MNCPGPMVWFDVPSDDQHDPGAVLECSACGAINVTGQPLDRAHALTPLLREGIATS